MAGAVRFEHQLVPWRNAGRNANGRIQQARFHLPRVLGMPVDHRLRDADLGEDAIVLDVGIPAGNTSVDLWRAIKGIPRMAAAIFVERRLEVPIDDLLDARPLRPARRILLGKSVPEFGVESFDFENVQHQARIDENRAGLNVPHGVQAANNSAPDCKKEGEKILKTKKGDKKRKGRGRGGRTGEILAADRDQRHDVARC